MPLPTNYQKSLDNAIWIDLNTDYTQNGLPDRLPDALAIVKCSIRNLLNCAPGQRARTFQPTYGSLWLQFIQEPICDKTAMAMETFMIQAIERWEPRVRVDSSSSYIRPNTNIPGYEVRIALSLPNLPGLQQLEFEVPV